MLEQVKLKEEDLGGYAREGDNDFVFRLSLPHRIATAFQGPQLRHQRPNMPTSGVDLSLDGLEYMPPYTTEKEDNCNHQHDE